MVTVKKDTVNRAAFENEMDGLKTLIRSKADPDIVIKAINNIEHRLIEYIDERDAELFKIPAWIKTIG